MDTREIADYFGAKWITGKQSVQNSQKRSSKIYNCDNFLKYTYFYRIIS